MPRKRARKKAKKRKKTPKLHAWTKDAVLVEDILDELLRMNGGSVDARRAAEIIGCPYMSVCGIVTCSEMFDMRDGFIVRCDIVDSEYGPVSRKELRSLRKWKVPTPIEIESRAFAIRMQREREPEI